MKTIKTALEMRLDFYGEGDSRAHDPDEIHLMEEYQKQSNPTLPTKEELLAFSNKWAETFEPRERLGIASAHYAASLRMLDIFSKTVTNTKEYFHELLKKNGSRN